MKIVTLEENTCGHQDCIAEHGLSLYIETEKHKLLIDTGQTDAVVKNAEVLGIELSSEMLPPRYHRLPHDEEGRRAYAPNV